MMAIQTRTPLGWWTTDGMMPMTGDAAIGDALRAIHQPVFIVDTVQGPAAGIGGTAVFGDNPTHSEAYPITAYSPPCRAENLGDASFCADHGLRFPYVSGGMANGIGSADIVEALAEKGMLGFFGAAGLSLERIEAAIDRLTKNLGDRPFGFNLIHNPNSPAMEAAVVDLYIRRGVQLAESSAYLALTLPVVRYRVHGIHRGPMGDVVTPNRLIAKVSRVEVASKFFAPPPEEFLAKLVESKDITPEQARMAAEIPMAQDVTAEADSGGHTDNRPALGLVPTLLALRDRCQAQYGFRQQLRVGAAGGIATPGSAAAAFSMGASYVLVGTINQSCLEAGTSDAVRKMLADAQQADVAMAPAADMFEMGVKVQVLKRGTMFAMRAQKLHDIYRTCNSMEDIPEADRAMLEKTMFRASLDDIWRQTAEFFRIRDPNEIPKAEADPKHKMALVFCWYLGQSSKWANSGEPTRQMDYQVWCGPAMGAFNEWVKGTFLEQSANRRVAPVALNLLYGAAVLSRANTLKGQGVYISPQALKVEPMPLAEIEQRLNA